MRFRTELCVLLLFTSVSGCALFQENASDKLQAKIDQERSRLTEAGPTGHPIKRIVRLTSSVIAQPVSENRIRQAVWRQMCEACLEKPQARRSLNQNGFRVGISQRPYPWALESLLSTSRKQVNAGSGKDSSKSPMFFSASGRGSGLPIVIPDGGESQIEVRRGTAAEIPAEASIPSMTGLKAGEEVRCVLRVKTIESQDGWTLVRFQPELHFGVEAMRLTVSADRDLLPMRQKIVPLFGQQFEIKLHRDDVVVLGYHPNSEWSLGQFFFQTDSLNSSMEHLLVLKMSGVETIEGRPSLQVNYRKN